MTGMNLNDYQIKAKPVLIFINLVVFFAIMQFFNTGNYERSSFKLTRKVKITSIYYSMFKTSIQLNFIENYLGTNQPTVKL